MNRIKDIVLEDAPAEAVEKLYDMLHGNEDLSAFFEDPYLDEVLDCDTSDFEVPTGTLH